MAEFRGVRRSGAGIEIRYQVRGRSFSRFLNVAPTEQALQDAARLRRKLIEDAKLGEAETPSQRITFEQACKLYLSDLSKHRKASTVHTYKKRLSAHWSSLAHLDVGVVNDTVIRRADRAQEWKSQKTRKDCLSALSCVLQWCVDERYIRENPVRGRERFKHQPPDIEVFSSEEVDAILKHLSGTPLALYSLMVETGCRTSELRALQWSDVEGDAIRIAATLWNGERVATKTHKVRRVLLTQRAKQILKGHTASRFHGGYVFLTTQGNPYDLKDLTEAFRKACTASGVKYRRPYTLRHTYASRALTRGVEPSWLAAQMGDRVETVLRHYARWIGGEADKRELAKLEGNWDKVGRNLTKPAKPSQK